MKRERKRESERETPAKYNFVSSKRVNKSFAYS